MAKPTYAKALTEAKALILEQKTQIAADLETLKKRDQEISQRKAHAADLQKQLKAEAAKVQSLESALGEQTHAREQAEATVGRQRVQLDSMEARISEMEGEAADLKQVVERQDNVLNEISANLEATQAELDRTRGELEDTRAQLPTAEDLAALADLNQILGHNITTVQVQETEQPQEPAPLVAAIYNDEAAEDDVRGGKKKNRSVFCFRAAA